jgi:hypothetical protein
LALTPAENDAFLREVDDDLRRDQLAGFGRRWGRPIAAAVVVGLILLAAILWWRHHREQQAGAAGEQLAGVLNDVEVGRAGATDPRLASLAQGGSDGYRALARMTQAGLAARTDPVAGAASYQAMANDATLPQAIRDLALIRATTLQFDTLNPAEVVARMQPLAAAGSPWFGSAGELMALAYLKQNRPAQAGPLFARIAAAPETPETLRGRAASMATSLGQSVTLPAGPAKE